MSLRPTPFGPVPEQTARIAQAAFPAGNPYLRMRDALEALVEDRALAHLFPTRGRPAETPWRLALVTIFQIAEDLSDRGAADAVRARIDWKYALALPLDDDGFDHTVLSKFRRRLATGWSREARSTCCSTHSWLAAAHWGCSRCGGASAPTRRMCWRPSAHSTVSRWCARRCAMPSGSFHHF